MFQIWQILQSSPQRYTSAFAAWKQPYNNHKQMTMAVLMKVYLQKQAVGWIQLTGWSPGLEAGTPSGCCWGCQGARQWWSQMGWWQLVWGRLFALVSHAQGEATKLVEEKAECGQWGSQGVHPGTGCKVMPLTGWGGIGRATEKLNLKTLSLPLRSSCPKRRLRSLRHRKKAVYTGEV